MSRARRAAAGAVDAFCRIVGRREVIRAARFALYRARLDLPNDPRTNGEYALQHWVLQSIPPKRPVTVFDVGANMGAWSRALLGQARQMRRADEVSIHAFEPASHTYRILKDTFRDQLEVVHVAVSDRVGEAVLHVVHPGAGTNSLYDLAPCSEDRLPAEVVSTTTVDEYVRRNGISRVDLLKIDTEGHDFLVLSGAVESFRRRMIAVAQFEYNHRWVYARHYLKDVFDLLRPLGYRVGKLTPHGLEGYTEWDPELETFVEGNYVAYAEEMTHRLPCIRWWKACPAVGA